jgi:hypothetical protein
LLGIGWYVELVQFLWLIRCLVHVSIGLNSDDTPSAANSGDGSFLFPFLQIGTKDAEQKQLQEQ